MKRLIFLLTTLFVLQLGFSRGQVDTVSVHAVKMKKEIKNVVVIPKDYSKRKHYPVVYLLHGYGDTYSKWVNTVPEIKTLATQHQLIIVCPDAARSWYMDSPMKPESQYESYITVDLLQYIDANYSTIPTAKARAITGLSMGGHGALYLAIRNTNLFANAGSMSGGVDLRYSTKQWEIDQLLGSYESKPEEWDNRSVVNLVSNLKNGQLNLIIDCGVNDFFYQINGALHRRLVALNINHDYTERPGAHNWEYWKNAINYQLLFFHRNFNTAGLN